MSKKFIAIAAAVAVAVIALAGGTLAWLTSTDTVTNTFTVGNVEITLDEAAVNDAGEAIPSAARVKTNTYHIVPGAVFDKDPTVTVLAGSEACLVYVYVDNQLMANGTTYAALDIDTDNWAFVGTYPCLYKYCGTPCGIVAKSSSATVLPAVFEHITINGADLDNANTAALASQQVIVRAFAIQSDNLGSADPTALAWDALNIPTP